MDMHPDAQSAIIQAYSQRMRAGELNPQEQAELSQMIDTFGNALLYAKSEMELAQAEAGIMYSFILALELLEEFTEYRNRIKGQD